MKRMYRQGDVLIVETDAIPASRPVPAENGRAVLAHGEATGHHHSYGTGRATLFREDGSGSGLYLQVTGSAPAALEHQEHDTIPTPVGNYAVIRQREWDAIGRARQVAD